MNPDLPQNEREQLEAKLTAFLLGELPPDEVVALCKAMDQDPELARLYEKLKLTIEFVREGAAKTSAETESSAQPLKLSENRREKLLAHFKTVAPKEFVKPQRPMMERLVLIVAVAAMVMVMASLILPSLAGSKTRAQRSAIVNNLRLLDGAEQQWALENRSRSNALPTMAELKNYMGRGEPSGLPSVAGEKYVPGEVSGLPKVEMNVAEAKKVFGPQIVAGGVVNDGKVTLSLDDVQGVIPRAPPQQPASAPQGQLATFFGQPNAVMTERKERPGQSPVKLKIVRASEGETAAVSTTTPVGGIILPAVPGGGGADGVFTFKPSREALETRTFKVDPNQFYAELQKAEANGGSAPGMQGPAGANSTDDTAGGLRYVAGLDPSAEIQTAVTGFFQSNGVNLDTRKGESVFFDDRQGTVMIRGTPKDLGIAQAAIDKFNNSSVATIQEQDKKVAAAQQKLDELRTKLHVSDAAANASSPSVLMTAENVKELESMRVQKQAEYDQQATQLGRLKGLNREELKKALPAAVRDPQLNTLLGELDLAEQSLIRLKLDHSPDSPRYQTAKNLVDDLNKKVDDRVDGIMAGLASKVDASKAYLDTMSKEVAAAEQTDIETGPNSAAYFVAKEELENEKRRRQILAMRTGQEEVDRNLPRARMVTIIEPATTNLQETPGLWGEIRHAFTGKVGSTARISVEQERSDIAGIGGNTAGPGYDPYFLQTEFETIQSQAVLSNVANALDLKDVWGKKYNGGQPMSETEVEVRIKSQLELKPVKKTKSIDIEAYGDSPEEAARLANQVALSYRQYRENEYEELKNYGVKSLQAQLDAQDKKVQLAQAKVDELAKQYNVSSTQQGTAKVPILSDIPRVGEAFRSEDRALPKPTVPPPTPQPEILTRENAFSTFSLNVSDVSFKLAAASLEKGQMPEPASIRSEEFINAFDYRDPEAPPGVPIAFASERARYPFAHNRELLRFSLKTAAAGRQAGRPLNIVLLLDKSGSMERADRVRIIQEAIRVLAAQLNAHDTFSIVTFARTAQLRVDGIPGNQAGAAAAEIAKLTPEGGTNLGEALDLAYEIALKHYLANGDNRVVLLTDGAANLGDVNPDALKQKVEAHRKQGVALDCFGVGWEDYNDDLLEVLTRNGDGRYGFINSPEEASTTFVSQIAGALHVAAQDVKVQVEFNPKRVIAYRQIGYAKHQLTKEQFRDNTVPAAEIAAREAGNALYTIEINPEGGGSVATVRVRYRVPGTNDYREQAWDVPYTGSAVALEQASPAMRLAATASAFSEWLATSPFADEVSPDALLRYLNGVPQVYGADKRPAKLEWMIRQAKSISGK